MKDRKRLIIVILFMIVGLLLVAGAHSGASYAASVGSAPSLLGDRIIAARPLEEPLQRVQTVTLEMLPGDLMSDMLPILVQDMYYNFPSPPTGTLRVPSDAWDISAGTPSGPLVITAGAEIELTMCPCDWITVTYRTRESGGRWSRAERGGNLITVTVRASFGGMSYQPLVSTLIYTRHFSAGAPGDYWGYTCAQLLSVDPGPTEQSVEEGWVRWISDTSLLTGTVVLREPLLGSNLTITQFLADPPSLELGQATRFTVTVENRGAVTASRWFYTELYIRPETDPPPYGPYDHVWGLITYQGDALFRTPDTHNWKIENIGPGDSITLMTVITVTGFMTGGSSYKAYAQVDTAYLGDVYHYYWFGANSEGYGIPPYPEEHDNITTLGTTFYIKRVYGLGAPSLISRAAPPGRQLVYRIPVSNTGNVSDTWSITSTAAAWPTSFSPVWGPVQNGVVSNVPITVTVPLAAPDHSTDVITLTIRSTGDPGKFAQVTVRTICEWYRLYLPIVFRSG